jgi:beta-xylosidase
VYSRKDEIIDRIVDKAVKELVRKGLPKLLERMDAEWQTQN